MVLGAVAAYYLLRPSLGPAAPKVGTPGVPIEISAVETPTAFVPIGPATPEYVPTTVSGPAGASLRIVGERTMRCRVEADSPEFGDLYWGGWLIRVDSSQYWLRQGEGRAVLWGPGNLILDEAEIHYTLSSDQIGWVVPDKLLQSNAMSSGGSKVERIGLELPGWNDWDVSDPATREYPWMVEFVHHEASQTSFPAHQVEVLVGNNGDLAMDRVSLFAFVLDSDGMLVDILWSGESSLAYGETTTLVARSLSRTGRCRGAADPRGYQLEWWVRFWTPTGETLSQFETTDLRAPYHPPEVGHYSIHRSAPYAYRDAWAVTLESIDVLENETMRLNVTISGVPGEQANPAREANLTTDPGGRYPVMLGQGSIFDQQATMSENGRLTGWLLFPVLVNREESFTFSYGSGYEDIENVRLATSGPEPALEPTPTTDGTELWISCNCTEIVSVDEPIVLGTGWAADSPEFLDDELAVIEFQVWVDGRVIENPTSYWGEIEIYEDRYGDNDIDGDGDTDHMVGWHFPLGALEEGFHRIHTLYNFRYEVTDGLDADADGELDTFGPGPDEPKYLNIWVER